MKKQMNRKIERALMGFASGVMVAASIWSLIIPAVEQSAKMGRWAFLPAFLGFWLGILFLCMFAIYMVISVMQMKNNYSVKWRIYGINGIVGDEGEGIFNGDTGTITAINVFEKTLTVTFDEQKEVEYEKDMLDELELAYAVTIHKSQGSEYPAVIIPLLEGPKMLYTRNLLYTAISRGTRCVMILGKWEMVKRMVETEGDLKRDTGLKERLREVFADGL